MPAPSLNPPLILASTSPYRRSLLGRLGLPFTSEAPIAEEATLPGFTPAQLAQHRASAKAQAVAARHPGAIVIGADQVGECDGRYFGKPITAERASQQLGTASGRAVQFHTAVLVMCAERDLKLAHLDLTIVHLRRLDSAEIARYIQLDEPFDCAASFRSEGLGSALFERIETQDPTALIGLPLIWLCGALRRCGLDPLH